MRTRCVPWSFRSVPWFSRVSQGVPEAFKRCQGFPIQVVLGAFHGASLVSGADHGLWKRFMVLQRRYVMVEGVLGGPMGALGVFQGVSGSFRSVTWG